MKSIEKIYTICSLAKNVFEKCKTNQISKMLIKMSFNVLNKMSSNRTLTLILFVSLCLNIIIIRDNNWLKNQIYSRKWFEPRVERVDTKCSSIQKLTENLSFENRNETGFPFNIVPNIVHYVLFDVTEITFAHFISILSALKNQKPDLIYIHCNCHQLEGDYYRRALKVAKNLYIPIIVRTIEKPTEIFGHRLNDEGINWHSSDITRVRVLQEFGGIYLDRDVYVVQSLDVFRKYEMTLNWDENQDLGNQVLIAHKSARFLKLWLDSYHDYRPNSWYFNAGELPTKSILYKRPELVHRLKGEFGADGPNVCPLIYYYYYPKWKHEFYTIHLILRGNEISFTDWCFANIKGPWPQVKFQEKTVHQLNVTFGEMTQILFDFEKSFNT